MQEQSEFFQTFFYQGHQIRTIEHKGETWWVASDVCKVLELVNVSLAVNGNDGTGNTGLDEDEKDYIMIHNVVGLQQATLCVNEPGLYHLISKSRTPQAKVFGRWVRHEVLPSIRKTGHYSLQQQEPQERHQQSSQGMGWQASLISLSEDELIREIDYQRAMLATVEACLPLQVSTSRQQQVCTGRTEATPRRNARATL